MSNWSSCNAILYVYTYKNLPNFRELVEETVNMAPQITGSEGNCKYTILNMEQGSSLSRPCTNCPCYNPDIDKIVQRKGVLLCPGYLYLTTKQLKNVCCATKSEIDFCHYYDRCNIVITGSLRDKTREQTEQEFNKFIKHLTTVLNHTFKVEVVCCSIK